MAKDPSKELAIELTKVFCATFKLYYLTHSCHWCVIGTPFYSVHLMLEEQYKEMFTAIDDIAEKIRQLDANPPSQLSFVDIHSPSYEDCSKQEIQAMTYSLAQSQTSIIDVLKVAIDLCKKYQREDLVNYLASRWEAHSKMRWMLRSTSGKID